MPHGDIIYATYIYIYMPYGDIIYATWWPSFVTLTNNIR